MNAAQQIRIWAGVVIGFLAAIGTFGMDGSLVQSGHMIYATNDSRFFTWFYFTLVCFAALGVLAAFTIYRWYKGPPDPKIKGRWGVIKPPGGFPGGDPGSY